MTSQTSDQNEMKNFIFYHICQIIGRIRMPKVIEVLVIQFL